MTTSTTTSITAREMAFLYLLAEGDELCGRHIRNHYEYKMNRKMPLGTMYSILGAMEKCGLVTSRMGEATEKRGGNRKMYFAITDFGRGVIKNINVAAIRREEWKRTLRCFMWCAAIVGVAWLASWAVVKMYGA